MPKTLTCHDAVLVFKSISFLAELKNYEITLRIYHAPIQDIPGRYYVTIQDEKHFYNSAWIVNLHKRSVEKMKLEKVLKEIVESRKPENVELMEYKREVRESPSEEIIL